MISFFLLPDNTRYHV